MKLFFSSPAFENEDLNIKARVIYLISLGTATASMVFVVVISFVAPALIPRTLILAGLVIPACIVTMALVRFSKLRLAGNLLLLMFWLVVTLGSITAGGVSAPIFAGYFIVIILSGLISSSRVRLYVTIICVASAILIAYAELSGYLPKLTPYPPMVRVFIYSFYFFMMLVLQNITSGNIRQLLKKTQESETRYRSL